VVEGGYCGMNNPCRYCVPPKRTATCHCDCPEWLSYKAEEKAKKETIHKAKMKEGYFTDIARKKATHNIRFKTKMLRRKTSGK
jgi:hypothetical protein